jgi:Na+/proline symporter
MVVGTPQGVFVMQWDLGSEGWALLAAISLGGGVVAALLVGSGWARRAWAGASTAVASFVVGLLTSEWLFGWATEEELQPNVDGLSRDEVLLSTLVTTAVVVAVVRYAHRRERRTGPAPGRHLPHRHRHA